MLIDPSPANDSAATGAVFEVGAADFEDKILRASMTKPVIAYFTAPWCGPCKQLGPLLEASVKAAKGEITLGKINLDDNQELAAALQIQSVPTIYAFFQGRPVDAFQGALPESKIKEFVAKLVQIARAAAPDALDVPEALKSAGQMLAAGDWGGAQGLYIQILQQDEQNAPAYAGLMRSFITAGAAEDAREMMNNVPESIASTAAFAEAKTALELACFVPAGESAALEEKLRENPGDHQARYDLAETLFSAGQKEEALHHLLQIIEKDKNWKEGAARLLLLKYFEALGGADPLTIAARKKLSSLLFS